MKLKLKSGEMIAESDLDLAEAGFMACFEDAFFKLISEADKLREKEEEEDDE